MKKLKWIITILFIIAIFIFWLANNLVNAATDGVVYNDVKRIPHNKVGLILGTSRYLGNGNPNYYFVNRIKAAVELYKAGKIDFIVVSGDNSKKYYNEPLDMQVELIKAGIPVSKIYLDYAGFRTYDSVVRLNKIFGQINFTVISQEFQNRRAIYVAKYLGLNAIGYNAKDIDKYYGFKTNVREKFSRVNLFFDLLFDKQPKFLGERIEVK